MNLENQVRLSTMRQKNPNDEIHLIYDATLLIANSLEELKNYCAENNIKPVAANEFNTQFKSNCEKELYQFYQDEIRHLKEGGNLAVASDILRWLSPVYKLGTYTDFDFPVDTSNLPPFMEIKAPLLLNIGSLKLGKKELILANNDYVAVIEEQAAKKQIEQIQQGMINKLRNYDNNFIPDIETKFQDHFIYKRLLNLIKNRSEALYIAKSKEINKESAPSRELRHYMQQHMSDRHAYIAFNRQNKESDALVIEGLRNNLNNQLTLIKRLFFTSEYEEIKLMLKQNDDAFIDSCMKKEYNLYLKSIIICTSGPIEICNALFGGYLLDGTDFINKVRPFSFNTYQLRKAFKSQNALPLHENLLGMMRFLGVAEGELNDSSWLETGRQLQEQRAKQLEQQKKEFALNLPESLIEIRKTLEEHLANLSRKQYSALSKTQKNTYIKVCQGLLNCFDADELNIDQCRHILNQCNFLHGNFFTNFYLNPTKKLVQEFEELCDKALVLGLTKNRKINWKQSVDL